MGGGINIFCGNMPFLGGSRIPTEHGETYSQWLTERYGGTGHTDYVGYFFRRASELMGDAGCIGFIATAAITDGDNRRTVLERMVGEDKFEVYAATTSFPWPGNAQVNVSAVHLARNLAPGAIRNRVLNDCEVEAINSRLRSGQEWSSPTSLDDNHGLALVGCFLRGEGFILEDAEARAFLEAHPEERDVIRSFLVGDDLNNALGQQARRYVIDFGAMTLDEARRYPAALAIVEERVRPRREQLKTTGVDAEHRKNWWRFANVRLELRARAAAMPRFLATARLSKRPVFAFVPSTWTPSEQVVVFPLPIGTAFAVLQSRIHRAWVSVQATHMGEGLRYSASECFAPFPFPCRDPAAVVGTLEDLGIQTHDARRTFALGRGIGLTESYNLLEEAKYTDADVVELRCLHEAIDRAVLAAYGWADATVPPYCPANDAELAAQSAFEDAIVGRLFELNAQRGGIKPEKASVVDNGEPTKAAGPGLRKHRATKPAARSAKSTGIRNGR